MSYISIIHGSGEDRGWMGMESFFSSCRCSCDNDGCRSCLIARHSQRPIPLLREATLKAKPILQRILVTQDVNMTKSMTSLSLHQTMHKLLFFHFFSIIMIRNEFTSINDISLKLLYTPSIL